MSWERVVYKTDKVITNWVTGPDAEELRAIFISLGRNFFASEHYAEWKESGYHYITWGAIIPGAMNIRDFTCYRRRCKIRWFKKESA